VKIDLKVVFPANNLESSL